MNDDRWKPLIEKAVYLSIAAVTLFAMFNAAMYYFTHDINSPVVASTNYQTDSDMVVFADVKPTVLITELNEVKNEGDLVKIDFSASNVNATNKVKTFECSIDDGKWVNCNSPVILNLKEYDDKIHTLEIRVIDNHDGIEETPLTHLFK